MVFRDSRRSNGSETPGFRSRILWVCRIISARVAAEISTCCRIRVVVALPPAMSIPATFRAGTAERTFAPPTLLYGVLIVGVGLAIYVVTVFLGFLRIFADPG